MSTNTQQTIRTKLMGGGIALTIGFVIVLTLIFKCTYTIPAGYNGVIYNLDGGIEGETLSQGMHVVMPWKHVTAYPTSTETVYFTDDEDVKATKAENNEIINSAIKINSKDGKRVSANATYAYHCDPLKLPDIFVQFKGQSIEQIENDYMKSRMLIAISDVTTQYSQMELSGDKLPQVNQEIFDKFHKDLEPIGIIVENFSLSGVEPDEQTKQAIQNVINAQNALEQSKVEKQQAEVEAEKARITAKGKADAALIEAEGQAAANAKLQESLTPLIIQQRQIEKWSGEVPKIISGNGTGLFFDGAILDK